MIIQAALAVAGMPGSSVSGGSLTVEWIVSSVGMPQQSPDRIRESASSDLQALLHAPRRCTL